MKDRTVRVLVIDDDPFIRKVLDRFLTERGFDVASARDGEEGLAKVASYAPHVVLLDFSMPKMNGIECLERIVAEKHDCGVIMISADADLEIARDTMAKGAADFIYKPFDLEYLETSLLAKLLAMGRP